MIGLFIWWAHRDLNPGQTDYEAVELAVNFVSKLKSPNEINLAVHIDPTDTESIPNLAGIGRLTEPGKWKNPNGFQWPNTELQV